MELSEPQVSPEPPSLIGSLKAGFDSIANHIGLVLFPLLFDVFLWMGPRLKLEAIIKAVVSQASNLPGLESPELAQSVQITQELWLVLAERLNLFAALRSYPVGVPSLMAGRLPLYSPLGLAIGWDLNSLVSIVGAWFGLTLLGLIIGTLFYEAVAQVSLNNRIQWREVFGVWFQAAREVVLLGVFVLGVLLALAIPGSCLVSIISLGNMGVGQVSALALGGLAVWVLFPLFLSSHGIFVYRQRMWASVKRSAFVTRMTFFKTGVLFILIILLSEGLNTLWGRPEETSWLALLGIAGHAFISTSLLAASFIYYRDATRWVQRLVQQAALSDRAQFSSRQP